MAWMCGVYLFALAIIAAVAVKWAVDDLTPVRDGKTDEHYSRERLAWLRECGKREGTWEPLRDFNQP